MKKLLLSTMALAAVSVAMAGPVTPQEALARVAQEQQTAGAANRAPAVADLTLLRTVNTPTQTPALYLFERGTDMLIVSADDATPSAMLGYVGNAEGEMPQVMQQWIESYVAQIAYMQSHPERFANPVIAKAPRVAKEAIAPLCTTVWNQDSPFNYSCPTINGSKTMTGCVATACAQVMKYFNYPESGTGTITYSDNGTTRTLALTGKKFDWDNMLDSYNLSYSTTERNAVAYLMQACGYAAHMSYGVSASGAQSVQMLEGAKTYFGYNSKAFNALRENYTIEDWNDLIYNNIKNVGPVYYSGHNALYEGHAFVVDGYSYDDFFHLNWGWGGYYDGYFKLSALAPEGQGIGGSSGGGFDFGQGAFINFTTPTGTTIDEVEPSVIAQAGSLKASGSGWTLTLTTDGIATQGVAFYNSSLQSGDFEWGYRYINLETDETDVASGDRVIENWGSYTGYRMVPIELDLDMGEYRIYPMIRTYPDGDWKPLTHTASASDYVDIVIGRKGISSVTNVAGGSLTVSDFALDSKMYWNKPFQTSFKVANPSEFQVYDGLVPVIFTVDSSKQITVIAQGDSYTVTMQPGESIDVKFPTQMHVTKNSFTGSAYLGLMSFANGTIYDGYLQVNVEKAPTSNTYASTLFQFVGDKANADANNLQFNCGVKCTAGYWAAPLTIAILKGAGLNGATVATFTSPDTYFLSANESAQATFGGALPDAQEGQQYEAYYYYIKGYYMYPLDNFTLTIGTAYSGVEDVATSAGDITVTTDASTITVTAPSAIASIELYGVDGRRVVADVAIDGTTAEVYTPQTGVQLLRINLLNGATHTAKVALR